MFLSLIGFLRKDGLSLYVLISVYEVLHTPILTNTLLIIAKNYMPSQNSYFDTSNSSIITNSLFQLRIVVVRVWRY